MLMDSDKKMIESQFQKLSHAAQERQKAQIQMDRHETAIRGLLALVDDENELVGYLQRLEEIITPSGFTDAIRAVLQGTTSAMTPVEVKDALSSKGFNLAGYSNALASIYTILKRLAQTEDVKATTKEGKSAYLWVGVRRFPRRSTRRLRAFVGQYGVARSLASTPDELLKVQADRPKKV
jgi:hypothetical protein